MYDKIRQDIIKAMKEKDVLKLQTLRGVKGDVDLENINKKIEITDELVIDVLSRQIKTRKESIFEFTKGGREDLIAKTKQEIELLQSYLPKQLSKEEVEILIAQVFNKVNPTSNKEMGLVMKELTPLIKGKYDMKEASLLVKDKISNL